MPGSFAFRVTLQPQLTNHVNAFGFPHRFFHFLTWTRIRASVNIPLLEQPLGNVTAVTIATAPLTQFVRTHIFRLM